MRTKALLVVPAFSILIAAPLAHAAPPGVTFDPGVRLRFGKPLGISQAAVSDAVAALSDPLSVQNGLSLYVQGGRTVSPEQVGFGAPYCRVDVEVGKVSGDDKADKDGNIPISGGELMIVKAPLRGNPHDYGGKEVKVGEKGQHLVESKWTPTGAAVAKGALAGTSLEFRFKPEPDSAIIQIVCAKKGIDALTVDDFLKVFGKLGTLLPPVQAASTVEEDRKAAQRAKTVGSTSVDIAKPAGEAAAPPPQPKDRLKEYEDARKSKKPAQVEKNEFDDMMAAPPADGTAPANPGDKKIGGGMDWLNGEPDAAKAAGKKGKKKKK